MNRLAVVALLALAACVSSAPASPSDTFFANLSALCGKTFAGRLESSDPADADFAGKPLVMGPVTCAAPGEVRAPFAVGEDRSRTWVITRVAEGHLRLKHDHRHADGSEDALSQYGGDTASPGTATRQDFPVDAFSRDLFRRQDLTRSLTNVWSLELKPGATFAYELNRENRHFRVAFDLAAPLP